MGLLSGQNPLYDNVALVASADQSLLILGKKQK